MSPFTVVSFYTPTWTYPAAGKRLISDCIRLGLDYSVVELPDTGNYLQNCRLKPGHLLAQFDKLRRPMLWVDVDASILRMPVMPMDADFAARPMRRGRSRHWHVGTLFFNSTSSARSLLEQWVAALDDVTSDEAALDRVWKAGTWSGAAAELPARYFVVKNRSHTWAEDPIILHRLSQSPAKLRARIKDPI